MIFNHSFDKHIGTWHSYRDYNYVSFCMDDEWTPSNQDLSVTYTQRDMIFPCCSNIWNLYEAANLKFDMFVRQSSKVIILGKKSVTFLDLFYTKL